MQIPLSSKSNEVARRAIRGNGSEFMIRIVSFALGMALSTLSYAQTAAPAEPRGPLARISPEMRAQFQADRKACVDQVKPRDLPRAERGKAMRGCMEAKNPAYKVAFERAGQRRAEMKQIRQDCRATIDGKRLTRDERRTAMQSCIVAKRPEMAKQFACQDQARQKNLGPGTERREFMRNCRRS
jgi:hypothetical protein